MRLAEAQSIDGTEFNEQKEFTKLGEGPLQEAHLVSQMK